MRVEERENEFGHELAQGKSYLRMDEKFMSFIAEGKIFIDEVQISLSTLSERLNG